MKFCPYCGAEFVDGALFCMSCGKPAPADPDTRSANPDPVPEKNTEPVPVPENPKSVPDSDSIPELKPRRPKYHDDDISSSLPDHNEEPVQVDIYDGYYDDVKPNDESRGKEPIDRELIKRIGFVGLGAAGVIAFAVLAMYLL